MEQHSIPCRVQAWRQILHVSSSVGMESMGVYMFLRPPFDRDCANQRVLVIDPKADGQDLSERWRGDR